LQAFADKFGFATTTDLIESSWTAGYDGRPTTTLVEYEVRSALTAAGRP
jgi:hypothetical protein